VYASKGLSLWISKLVLHLRRTSTYHADISVKRKLSDCEYFTYLDNDITYQEQLHLSVRDDLVILQLSLELKTDLRPTAACFRSDRHKRYPETAIATPQSRIDPGEDISIYHQV
jgi:hypothetical protein